MQDRFKFRVWSKANNKYCHHITTDLSADGLLRVLRPLEKSEYIDDWEHQYDIQQCTGLKDKNDKLIYEGDIVKIFHVSGTMQGKLFTDVVEWNQLRCRFDTERYGVFNEDDIYEVIGNVYQNPELLEE